MSEQSPVLYKETTATQRFCGIAGVIFAGASMIMTAYWAHGPNVDEGYLGGLNMNEQIFNWHPVLMVAGLVFSLTSGVLSYRLLPIPHTAQKIAHVLCHSGAVVCMSVGLACVLKSANDTSKNPYGAYSPNFYTIHSFIGIAVICLYGLNFILGLFHYMMPNTDIVLKQKFMPTHVFLGTFLLFAVLAAVESGIMYVNSGCYYQPSKADLNPAENYSKLSDGCILGNNIGIMVLISVFYTFYAMFRFGAAKSDRSGENDGKHLDLQF